MAAAKRQITEDRVITGDDMVELLIHQLTNNANGTDTIDMLVDLNKSGVSVRSLAKAIGVSHTTLDYQIKKAVKEVVSDGD